MGRDSRVDDAGVLYQGALRLLHFASTGNLQSDYNDHYAQRPPSICKNESDEFASQARCKPQLYPQVSRGFGETHVG